ncbi:MAG: DNA primase, partial [Chitinophagaceae bacterium]
MEPKKRFFTCDDAKDLDIVNFLSNLGFEPTKIRNQDCWYWSPLRLENTPSFKVNRKLNRWYDHGIGKGGNLIDFGILYHDCTVKDFLEKLGSATLSSATIKPFIPEVNNNYFPLIILNETNLKSARLLDYLNLRHVPLSVAQEFCQEVTYQVGVKTYNAIGFKNDSG